LALAGSDPKYVALNREIEALRGSVDPEKVAVELEEPYRMAMRDPELIAAGRELNRKVWGLDEQLRRA